MKAKRLLSLLLVVMMVVGLVPLSIVSISAAEPVKLNGSSESYDFTADSWTIDETTDNDNTSTLTTADGKTFRDEGHSYTSGRWQTNGGKATSVDSFDFSDGFKFTMTWTVLAPSGGKWGNKHVMDFGGFQVVICDAIQDGNWQKPTIDYYIGTGFLGAKGTEGADKYTPNFENQLGYYNTGVQTSTNMTTEQMATLNTTFTVVYAGGYASLYVDSMKSTDNPTGIVTWTVDDAGTTATKIAVDASTMSNVQLSISKEWSWTNSQDVMVIDSLTGVDASDIETETETTPVETETEPAETETTPIESETTAITTDGEFTADSWIIADKTEDTSNPTVSTADGKTFVTIVFEDGTANSPAIITSKAKYDLSNGFVFSFDADLCRIDKNSWSADGGGNTTTISFGDEVTLEINGTGYSLIVDGTRHKLNINNGAFGWSPKYAPSSSEQVALVNANYKVKYADGKVSLYVNDSLITFSDGLSEIDVTGNLSASTVRIFRGWCWSTDTTTFASLKNLDLEITAAPTPVAPVYEGIQEGAVDGVFSVRFVGTADSLNYSEVGFKITAMDGEKSWTKSTNTVYSKLIGNTDTGVVEYTEENLNGQYIYALTIQGVPTEGTVTFNVTAYGIVDGVEVTDTTYAVTYTDGAYVGTFAVD